MRPTTPTSAMRLLRVALFAGAAGLMLPGITSAADLEHARDLLNQQKNQQAADEAARYLAENPGDTQARFIRGLALARSGKVDDAIGVFRELADEHPDLAEPRNNLGVLYAQQGQLRQAREALEKAVEINPEHAPAQENLADVYVGLARDAYAQAGRLEQSNVAVREKRERLQTLLDAPRQGQENYQAAPTRQAAQQRPEVTPSPAPEYERRPASPSVGGVEGQLQRAANDWASAWSQQDVRRYLSAYSSEFQPESGQSRASWERERERRVTRPNSISVQLSDFDMEALDDGRYILSFLQRYRSDNYRDRERKALLLTQESGEWKIQREDSPSEVRSFSRNASFDGPQPETLAPGSRGNPDAAAPASDFAGDSAVRSVVQSWAQAWSDQNLDGYFAAYSDNFTPEGNQDLRAWIRERQDRIGSPSSIRVRIDNLRVESTGPDTAEARFTQRYESDGYRDRSNKTLRMRKENGNWHITREIGG